MFLERVEADRKIRHSVFKTYTCNADDKASDDQFGAVRYDIDGL